LLLSMQVDEMENAGFGDSPRISQRSISRHGVKIALPFLQSHHVSAARRRKAVADLFSLQEGAKKLPRMRIPNLQRPFTQPPFFLRENRVAARYRWAIPCRQNCSIRG